MSNKYRICFVDGDTQQSTYAALRRPGKVFSGFKLDGDVEKCHLFDDYALAKEAVDRYMTLPKLPMARILGYPDVPPRSAIIFVQKLDKANNPTVVLQRIYHFGLAPGQTWEQQDPAWYNTMLEKTAVAYAEDFFSTNVKLSYGEVYNVTLCGNNLTISYASGDDLFTATCMVVEHKVVKLENVFLHDPLKASICPGLLQAAIDLGHID